MKASALSRKIGTTLREVRRSKGFSQQAVAIACGVSTNTVSRWETGVYSVPCDALKDVATFLQVPVATFFGEDADAYIASRALGAMNRFALDLGLPIVIYAYAKPTRRKS